MKPTRADPQLTKEEWLAVRERRGQEMCRFPVHDCGDLTYYWAWGSQPRGEFLEVIGDRCPIRAATKFLKYFHAGPAHNYPIPLDSCPKWMTKEAR